MSNGAQAICRLLGESDVGLTADELTAALGAHKANVRQELSTLVFHERAITCTRDGRYKLGSPDRLLELA